MPTSASSTPNRAPVIVPCTSSVGSVAMLRTDTNNMGVATTITIDHTAQKRERCSVPQSSASRIDRGRHRATAARIAISAVRA